MIEKKVLTSQLKQQSLNKNISSWSQAITGPNFPSQRRPTSSNTVESNKTDRSKVCRTLRFADEVETQVGAANRWSFGEAGSNENVESDRQEPEEDQLLLTSIDHRATSSRTVIPSSHSKNLTQISTVLGIRKLTDDVETESLTQTTSELAQHNDDNEDVNVNEDINDNEDVNDGLQDEGTSSSKSIQSSSNIPSMSIQTSSNIPSKSSRLSENSVQKRHSVSSLSSNEDRLGLNQTNLATLMAFTM